MAIKTKKVSLQTQLKDAKADIVRLLALNANNDSFRYLLKSVVFGEGSYNHSSDEVVAEILVLKAKLKSEKDVSELAMKFGRSIEYIHITQQKHLLEIIRWDRNSDTTRYPMMIDPKLKSVNETVKEKTFLCRCGSRLVHHSGFGQLSKCAQCGFTIDWSDIN